MVFRYWADVDGVDGVSTWLSLAGGLDFSVIVGRVVGNVSARVVSVLVGRVADKLVVLLVCW